MGVWSLLAFNAFFIGADRVLRIIGAALPSSRKALAAEEGRLAAQLRAAHQRAHDYREEIAMQSGVSLENAACATAFEATSRHRLKTIWLEAILDVIKSYVIKYGGMMCAFSVLIPSVYLAPKGSAKLGTPQQVTAWYLAQTQLLVALANAVKDLADSLGGAYTYTIGYISVCRYALHDDSILTITLPFSPASPGVGKLKGCALRIYELKAAISAVDKDIAAELRSRAVVDGDAGIKLFDISIAPPTKTNAEEESERELDAAEASDAAARALLRNLSLSVQPGQHVIVRGPNGVGKTSLFRSLSGLWPLVAGSAALPSRETLHMMPQRAYFTDGCFAEQVTYPRPASELLCMQETAAELVMARGIEATLAAVGLTGLVRTLARECGAADADADADVDAVSAAATRVTAIAEEEEKGEASEPRLSKDAVLRVMRMSWPWRDRLSGGQKQRVMWARMLWQQPTFAFLDEGTAAVDVHGVAPLFKAAKDRGITLITVAHDASIAQYHTHALDLGRKQWTFGPLKEARGARQARRT